MYLNTKLLTPSVSTINNDKKHLTTCSIKINKLAVITDHQTPQSLQHPIRVE